MNAISQAKHALYDSVAGLYEYADKTKSDTAIKARAGVVQAEAQALQAIALVEIANELGNIALALERLATR